MLKNIHPNCVGTTSFDALFPSMRKYQEFTVYPMQESGSIIKIQSGNRFGKLNLENGECEITSPSKGSNSISLALDKARGKTKCFKIPTENLSELKSVIKSTAGTTSGSHGLIVSNIGAIALK